VEVSVWHVEDVFDQIICIWITPALADIEETGQIPFLWIKIQHEGILTHALERDCHIGRHCRLVRSTRLRVNHSRNHTPRNSTSHNINLCQTSVPDICNVYL